MSRPPLGLPERHRAARLLHELCRPASAAVLAQLPARPGASIAAAIARRGSGLSVEEFWTAVSRLETYGVLQRAGDTLRLDRDQLERATASWVEDSPLHAVVAARPQLRPFVRFGRVVQTPTDPRLVDQLYRGLADLFVPGETLSEADVNARVAAVHDDPAEVRRAMVDLGLFDRSPGSAIYVRHGG